MIERKYLAHYLDSSFGGSTTTYVRIGKDLEEYSEELNPSVDITQNILGETSVRNSGYQPQGSVDPYYTEYDDALSTKILEIANTRATGDATKTTMVDVLIRPGQTASADPTVVWAYREDVYVVPDSVGGDTTGIQTPFTIYKAGNRVAGTFDLDTKAFTPS